ncbi:hypothetical protein Gpo141_00004683 [Globisporangium polare]
MKALDDKKESKSKRASKDAKKKKKSERPERKHLRAVEEQEGDGTGGGEAGDRNSIQSKNDDEDGDNSNSSEGSRHTFTQAHIAQLFGGELDEFASLPNQEINSNSNGDQRQQPMRIQYIVENEISGDFFRVRGSTQQRKPWGFTAMGSSFSTLESRGSTDHDRSLWSQLGSNGGLLRDLETALVVMCQGILAGLCWMDAFNLSSSDGASVLRRETKDMFACTYSAVADRSRQLFFILFKYPFSLRKLSQRTTGNPEKEHGGGTLGSTTRREAQIGKLSFRLLLGAVAFTLSALLVLLIAAPAAIRLSHAYQNDSNWCSGNAEKSSTFKDSVVVLRTSAVLNAVLMSGAWFCVSLQCHLGYSTNASNQRLNAELKRAHLRQEKRMDHLCGVRIERLSTDELKELIQTHQRAIDATESVLVSKLQLQQSAPASSGPLR